MVEGRRGSDRFYSIRSHGCSLAAGCPLLLIYIAQTDFGLGRIDSRDSRSLAFPNSVV